MAVDGRQLTMGELIAFNMIANQAIQPILRLSNVWQDFSKPDLGRTLGGILNAPPESGRRAARTCRRRVDDRIPQRHLSLIVRARLTLKGHVTHIKPGEVVGIVSIGAESQRWPAHPTALPTERGQILLDGSDLSQAGSGLAAAPYRRSASKRTSCSTARSMKT